MCSISPQSAFNSPSGSVSDVDGREARLAFFRLEEHANFYLLKGVAPNTARAYKLAQSRHWAFCAQFSLLPLPTSEQTLILFVAELAQDLAHSTIRSYLSGVRNLHITNGLPDPLPGSLRLNLVLNGIW